MHMSIFRQKIKWMVQNYNWGCVLNLVENPMSWIGESRSCFMLIWQKRIRRMRLILTSISANKKYTINKSKLPQTLPMAPSSAVTKKKTPTSWPKIQSKQPTSNTSTPTTQPQVQTHLTKKTSSSIFPDHYLKLPQTPWTSNKAKNTWSSFLTSMMMT